MSYYKYVKRDEKSRVDWGAITTNLVDTLREQEAEREKQREEIDASSRATGEVLSDAPQGANKAASTWILNASSDASQYLMSQNRLLKSGFLDPRDFTVNRQNVENSFKSLQTMAESAHKESQLTQDRINEGKAMNFEGVVGQRLDDFQNFEKTQVYFNPTNGVASIGIKDEEGKLSDDPSKFSTIEGAIAQMQSRYDKLDYTSPLVKWSESIGSDVRVVRENGILTVEDPSVREDVNSSLDDAIGALMVNDLRVLSIAEDLGIVAPDDYDLGATETTWGAGLTDAETTRLSELESMDSLSDSQQAQLDKLISKRNKSSRKVGVSTANDGTVIPKANEALKEAVKERLKKEGMALLDYKQTAMPKDYSRDAYYRNLGDKNKKLISKLDNVAGLYSGNVEELQSTIQDIMGGNTTVTYAKRTNRGIEIKTADGKGDAFLSFYTEDKDGNEILMSAADFTKSAVKILTGDTEGSYDDILEEGMWSPKRTNFNAIDVVEFKRGAEPVDYMAPYRELENKITAEPFKSSDNSAASTLSKILSPLGFTVEPTNRLLNEIIVRDLRGDKESITIPTNESSEDADSQMAKLKAWISEHRTDMEKARFGQQQGGRLKFNGQ